MDQISSSSGVHLPLEPLLVLLRNKGFRPKPDDYVEFLKVIEEFGSEDMDKVAALICPLIATNEQEQVKFYKVFDAYKQFNQEKIAAPPPTRRVKWYYILAGMLILALCALLIYKAYPRREMHVLPTMTVVVGDTVQFSAYSSLEEIGELSDSSKVEVSWDFGAGWTKNGIFKTSHVFTREGNYQVRLRLKSSNFRIGRSINTFSVAVCKGLPVVTTTPAKDIAIHKGGEVAFSAIIEDEKKIVKDYYWTISNPLNDSTSVFHSTELKYRFDTTGRYHAIFSAFSDSACSDQKSLMIDVTDTTFYQLGVIQSGNNIELATKPNPYVSWLLLIPGIAGLASSLWYRNILNKKKKRPAESSNPKEQATPKSFKPPYEIPFENNDGNLVYCERGFRDVLRTLRQKTEDEIMVLNVSQTIRNTIRSGGYPGAIFTPKLKPQEYLVLIDRSNPKSMMAGLFDFVVRSWKDENISVERFYYTRGFKNLYNENYPAGISLRRLSELYKNSILLLLGSSHELVYSAYPVIDKDLLEEFNEWEHNAILTPVSYPDWGEKEKVIGSYYLLLPADVEGQLPLVSAIKERMYNQQPYLSSIADRFYEVDWYDFNSVKEIKEYLQQDESLFQWLCAITVFPKLRWEFFVEAGRAILEKYAQAEKLNYTNLLKLCRIKWVREGVFPESTRLELLKELKVDNEIIARETLLKMYNYADDFYKDDFFFGEEKDLQKITNQFVLYAHDAENYSSYKDQAEQFKQLWEKNQVPDGPFRLYMDKKPGDKWLTPIDTNNPTNGINDFFKQEDKSGEKKLRTRKSISTIISVLSAILIAIWGFFHLSWNSIQNRIPDKWKNVVAVDDLSANQNISYSVDTNLYCRGTVLGYVPSAEITTSILDFNGKELVTSGVKNQISIPGDTTLFNSLTAIISWGRGAKQTIQTFKPSKNQIEFRIQNCPDSSDTVVPTTPSIRADSCSKAVANFLPGSLNEIWVGATNRRLLTIDIRRRVVYYSTGDKKTFGTYRLEEVCNANGSYKLILAANGQYRVFFLRNMTGNGFQLSVCPDFYMNREEIDKISQACGNYESMQWFYESRAEKACYIPWSGANYTQDNLSYLQNNVAYVPTVNPAEYTVNINSVLYPGPQQLANRLEVIRNGFPLRRDGRKTDWSRKQFGGTPFDRDFIEVKIKDQPSPNTPDCNTVYRSLQQANQYPNMVCRINLARQKLTSLPKELYNFVNLQELDVRYNSIPLNEIQVFQKQFPKCKVLYDPQSTPNVNDNSNERPEVTSNLGTITFSPKPDQKSMQLINRVGKYLANYPRSKVILEADYSSASQQKDLQQKLASIRRLLNNAGANNKQVEENLINNAMQQQNQSNRNVLSQRAEVRMLGVNFPENFSTPPKTY